MISFSRLSATNLDDRANSVSKPGKVNRLLAVEPVPNWPEPKPDVMIEPVSNRPEPNSMTIEPVPFKAAKRPT